MIEPRSSLFHVHRRDNSKFDGNNSDSHFFFGGGGGNSNNNSIVSGLTATEFVIEHDEPERPIHPALEYEVLLRDPNADPTDVSSIVINEDDQDQQPLIEIENGGGGGISPGESLATTLALEERKRRTKRNVKLILSFIFLVISGVGHVISLKLQAIPMYNYPNFLNLFTHIMYIPIAFCYIIPVARYGWFGRSITPEQIAVSRKPFAIMGALDGLAYTMQIFASIYLPGPLLVLLPQAVIPCCMVMSHSMLGERYHWRQYLGAVIVLIGIVVVLEPVLTYRRAPEYYCEAMDMQNSCTICQPEVTQEGCLAHTYTPEKEDGNGYFFDDDALWHMTGVMEGGNSSSHHSRRRQLCQWIPNKEAVKQEEGLVFVWSLVLLASTVPMTLSTIYKQVALQSAAAFDPIYLNGWIAIFQLFFAIILAIPAALVTTPSITPADLPNNLWNGLLCFRGQDSIDTGCHPDQCSFHSALFVCFSLVSTVVYSFCMMFVLKYGSTNMLFMAQTILVPCSNLAFSMPIMPQAAILYRSDVIGLAILLLGLILYRFWGDADDDNDNNATGDDDDEQSTIWFQNMVQRLRERPSTPWFQDMLQHLSEPQAVPWFQDVMQQLREPLLTHEEEEDENHHQHHHRRYHSGWTLATAVYADV